MNNVLYLYLIIYKDLWTSILIVTLILKKRCVCNFSFNRMIVLTTKGVCLWTIRNSRAFIDTRI